MGGGISVSGPTVPKYTWADCRTKKCLIFVFVCIAIIIILIIGVTLIIVYRDELFSPTIVMTEVDDT